MRRMLKRRRTLTTVTLAVFVFAGARPASVAAQQIDEQSLPAIAEMWLATEAAGGGNASVPAGVVQIEVAYQWGFVPEPPPIIDWAHDPYNQLTCMEKQRKLDDLTRLIETLNLLAWIYGAAAALAGVTGIGAPVAGILTFGAVTTSGSRLAAMQLQMTLIGTQCVAP